MLTDGESGRVGRVAHAVIEDAKADSVYVFVVGAALTMTPLIVCADFNFCVALEFLESFVEFSRGLDGKSGKSS
ncbi:MAG: hypothetical protein V4857_14450 [Pseudomonadota bacterium]